MINFKMYTWSCSEGVVWYLYLYGTWRYKTYRNPVYINMIKNIQFHDVHAVGLVVQVWFRIDIPSRYMEIKNLQKSGIYNHDKK